jgi:hypothetical protein
MNRPLKNAERGAAKVEVKSDPSTGLAGPAKFDGRSNLHAPALKQVVNKDQGLKGKSTVAGRVP